MKGRELEARLVEIAEEEVGCKSIKFAYLAGLFGLYGPGGQE